MTHTPLPDAHTPEHVTPDRPESGSARHRRARSVGTLTHPATWLTTAIAVATVGVAGYVATSSGSAAELDSEANQAQASLNAEMPGLTERAATSVQESMQQQRSALGWAQVGRTFDGIAALDTSQRSASLAVTAAHQRSAQIAAQRQAAEQEAADEAAAEQKAADEAATQKAADERATEQEAASRSQERAAAPAPEPESEPEYEPEPASAPSGDPRSIARSMLGSYGWSSDQFGCLESLWSKESGWNTYAENASSGAYGIPQSLPGAKMASAGSDWRSNPATQIRWGLGYISGRYGSPCTAWSHSQANNWY